MASEPERTIAAVEFEWQYKDFVEVRESLWRLKYTDGS